MPVTPATKALPRRFRRPRLLIIGCGDVGLRLLNPAITGRFKVYALTRSREQMAEIRQAGGQPICFDLDTPDRRRKPESLARYQIYLAPPSPDERDTRLASSLARTLAVGANCRIAYVSTTGVYGPAKGRLLKETSPTNPVNARAKRRVAAERLIRASARRPNIGNRIKPTIFRAPGIYAADRLPISRLQTGTPVLQTEHDSFSNHIHADDLAQMLWLALFRGKSNRIYLATDGQDLRMGDYFDQVADATGLPRPPRLPREQVKSIVSPAMWSYMSESRRFRNDRVLSELRITLKFPTVGATLASLQHSPIIEPAKPSRD